MVSIFKRLFRVAEANTHSVIDKFEDPIKLTEQGIRDLKKDFELSMTSLAEAKAGLIKMRRDSEERKTLAQSYENKAILLLQKAQGGGISSEEADRLASAALAKKDEVIGQASGLMTGVQRQEEQTAKLELRVQELKASIAKWENELVTLKARAKVAEASKKLNKQLAQIDSSSTITLLEKMREKVSVDEALAESYGDMAGKNQSLESELDKALAAPTQSAASGTDSLAALKARLNLS